MAGDHALVAFRSFAEVLAVNAADVRTANRRRLHPKENFAVTGTRVGHFAQLGCAVAREISSRHCAMAPSTSQRSSQLCPWFHKNTCPLINRQFLSMPAIARMSPSV